MGKAESAFSRSMQMEDTTIGWRFINPQMKALYGVHSMPETAENVADEFAISRADGMLLRFVASCVPLRRRKRGVSPMN